MKASVWDIAFSKDPQQTYIYLADGRNMKVRILRRDTLEELTSFGDGGRQPGQFYAVHSVATDSKGNLYTTETYEGKARPEVRVQGHGAGTVADARASCGRAARSRAADSGEARGFAVPCNLFCGRPAHAVCGPAAVFLTRNSDSLQAHRGTRSTGIF